MNKVRLPCLPKVVQRRPCMQSFITTPKYLAPENLPGGPRGIDFRHLKRRTLGPDARGCSLTTVVEGSAARLAALARFSLPAQRFALRAKDLSATAMVKSTCTARIFRRDQSGAPLCERKTAASEACSRSCFDAFSVSISLGKTRSVPSARVETLRCSKPSLKKQLGPQFGFPAAVICALHSQAASGAIRPPRCEAFPANR